MTDEAPNEHRGCKGNAGPYTPSDTSTADSESPRSYLAVDYYRPSIQNHPTEEPL